MYILLLHDSCGSSTRARAICYALTLTCRRLSPCPRICVFTDNKGSLRALWNIAPPFAVMGRSGFRLGSGARSPRPRSTATASKCFSPALWLYAGALMFALVTANMEVNDQQDFTISQYPGMNRGNAIPAVLARPPKFLGNEPSIAPSENTIAPSETLVRTTKGHMVPIVKLSMLAITIGWVMFAYHHRSMGPGLDAPTWDPAARTMRYQD